MGAPRRISSRHAIASKPLALGVAVAVVLYLAAWHTGMGGSLARSSASMGGSSSREPASAEMQAVVEQLRELTQGLRADHQALQSRIDELMRQPKPSGGGPPTLAELQARRTALAEIKEAGFGCGEAKSFGYTCAEAKRAGYFITIRDAKEAGYSMQEVKAAGYSMQEVKEAGYRDWEETWLLEHGYP